jgi:hypothetical protein
LSNDSLVSEPDFPPFDEQMGLYISSGPGMGWQCLNLGPDYPQFNNITNCKFPVCRFMSLANYLSLGFCDLLTLIASSEKPASQQISGVQKPNYTQEILN